MSWGDLAVVAALIVLWTVISGRAEQIGITAPMVFAIGGLALGGEHALHISLSASTIKGTAEITLVLILFSDAARLRLTSLRHDMALPVRLLGIGLPLTIVMGAIFAAIVFKGLGAWSALLVAACLAPTDAGLGAGIITNSALPSRVRRALNVESGLNDGIVAPLVSIAVAVLIGQSNSWGSSLLHALREVGVGALIGIGIGLATGWLLSTAVRRGWTEPGTASIAIPASAIGTYAFAVAAGTYPVGGGKGVSNRIKRDGDLWSVIGRALSEGRRGGSWTPRPAFDQPDNVVGVFWFVPSAQSVDLCHQERQRPRDPKLHIDGPLVLGEDEGSTDDLDVGGQQFAGFEGQSGEATAEIVFAGWVVRMGGTKDSASWALLTGRAEELDGQPDTVVSQPAE